MNYNCDLIFNYITGNQIDEELLEKLENNEKFMTYVLRLTNDTKMYNYCSDTLKTKYSFVKFLIEHFQDNISFILNVANNYLKNGKPSDIEELEVIITLSNLYDKTKDERLFKYKELTKIFSLYFEKIDNFFSEHGDEESKEKYGLGFIFVFDDYGNSTIILDLFAKTMLKLCLYDNKKGLEIKAHEFFETVDELEEYGDTNFILDFIDCIDPFLCWYVSENMHLLTEFQQKIKKIKSNWTNYIKNISMDKVGMVIEEMCEYENKHSLYDIDCKKELVNIIKKLQLEEIFKNYPIIINYENNDELIEEESLCFDEYNMQDETKQNEIKKYAYIDHMTKYIKKLFSKTNIEEIEEMPKEKTKAKIINYDFNEGKVISITE